MGFFKSYLVVLLITSTAVLHSAHTAGVMLICAETDEATIFACPDEPITCNCQNQEAVLVRYNVEIESETGPTSTQVTFTPTSDPFEMEIGINFTLTEANQVPNDTLRANFSATAEFTPTTEQHSITFRCSDESGMTEVVILITGTDPPQPPSNVKTFIESVIYPTVKGEISWDPVESFVEVSYNITSPSINVNTEDTRVPFQIDWESAEENYTVTIRAIRCGLSSNPTTIPILENFTIDTPSPQIVTEIVKESPLLSDGAIIGIIVGVILGCIFVVIIILIVVFYGSSLWKRNLENKIQCDQELKEVRVTVVAGRIVAVIHQEELKTSARARVNPESSQVTQESCKVHDQGGHGNEYDGTHIGSIKLQANKDIELHFNSKQFQTALNHQEPSAESHLVMY